MIQPKQGKPRPLGRGYERYREVLRVNAQAVIQKNNEAWNSFFALLRRARRHHRQVTGKLKVKERKSLLLGRTGMR